MVAGESIANQSAPSRTPVPMPDVGLKANAPDVTLRSPVGPLPLPVNQLSEAPVAPKPGGVEALQILPTQPQTFIEVNASSRGDKSVLNGFRGDSRQSSTIETAQGPRDMPRFQPSLIEGRPESRLKPTPERRLKLRDA